MLSSTGNNLLKTILVTGSNKGIGHGLVRYLLQKNINYNVILTSRSDDRGIESFNKLSEEFQNKKEKFFYHQLDITDNESITNLFNWIKSQFGQIDILVNNAGVAAKGPKFDIDVFNFTFPTNVYGTINISERAIDEQIIRQNGRIVIIGSTAGKLSYLKSESLVNEFKDENLTLDGLLNLAERFKQSIIDNKVNENGWFEAAYSISKIIINTYARVLSKRKEIEERNISVYACCPGWVRTDMAGQNAHLSIEEGVITPAFLIEMEDGIKTDIQGKFFYLCKPLQF
jgi:NAD(P)-dependent dehydrogenase (short-subunit alcohol dehydrogenase family)